MQSNGTLLEARGLTAFYGDFQALFDIDFRIKRNETVAIIGQNGSGKSTLLKSIIGLVRAKAEAIYFDGKAIGGNPAYRIVAQGISMVPEGRRLFPSLSVEENLSIGAYSKRQGPWNLEAVYAVFSMLKEKRNAAATALSGGQQQMVAIGRALMANPQLLLCDEISLGLAPVVIRDIYAALPKVRYAGAAMVVVEQDIGKALAVADRVYCMMEGRVTLVAKAFEVTRQA